MGKLWRKDGKKKDPSQARLDQLVPVAMEMVKQIALRELKVGNLTPKDEEAYLNASTEMLQFMLDSGVKYSDKEFLFQLILQPFDKIGEIVKTALAKSFDNAINNLMGKEFRELTLKDIDNILKNINKN